MNPFKPREERFSNTQERDRWEAYSCDAQNYLGTYPKTSYYFAEECESKVEYIPYTDGELWKIKKIVLKLWNASSETPATSFNALKITDYSAFKGKDKDLDTLIWGRAHEYGIEPNFLNLYNPVHLYKFSLLTSEGEQRILRVDLKDEEYKYLLTEQLFDPEFNLDKLSVYNPEFANLFRNVQGDAASIRFDELIEDARAITGHVPMNRPFKITSMQQLFDIVYASRLSHHFFIQTRIGRLWKTIEREEFDYDKDGNYKLSIRDEICKTVKIVTKAKLERDADIVQAIAEGRFYLYDDYDEAPREERMEQQSIEVAIFPTINKQWLIENADALQKFIDAKSKDFEGIIFTAEDVLVHEESLLPALGELWVQEYLFYLPAIVRKAEYESAEQGKLTLSVWLAENHSLEELQQYLSSLNTEELGHTITGLVLARMDLQKYLFLTQEKLAEAIAYAKEHAKQPKRKAKEEKNQMSLNFD